MKQLHGCNVLVLCYQDVYEVKFLKRLPAGNQSQEFGTGDPLNYIHTGLEKVKNQLVPQYGTNVLIINLLI